MHNGKQETTQEVNLPLGTVACHEDLTAGDLVGGYLLEGEETRWFDGPLTRAVKAGAICYLDEVVEARKRHYGAYPPAYRPSPHSSRGEEVSVAASGGRILAGDLVQILAIRARSRTSSRARASVL